MWRYIEKPKMRNRRLELPGQDKRGNPCELICTGPGLDPQEDVGQVFGQIWNQTDPFLWLKPGPLAGYPDPLSILL